MRSIKELHYFDTVAKGNFARQIALKQADLDALRARKSVLARFSARRRDLRDWIAVLERGCEDIAAYLDYMTAGRGARRVVGDITPAYALLSEPALRRIATMAADVRVVYLLRDPVARLWSQVRMLARRRVRDMADYAETARKLMERALTGGEARAVVRGDYAGALARLDAAVDPRRLLVLFQDDLFSGDGLVRLTRYLGIAPVDADLTRRVHEGVPLTLEADHHARAVALLRPQYAYVEQRFGGLPESWQRSLARGAA